jgi:hypothetical protein
LLPLAPSRTLRTTNDHSCILPGAVHLFDSAAPEHIPLYCVFARLPCDGPLTAHRGLWLRGKGRHRRNGNSWLCVIGRCSRPKWRVTSPAGAREGSSKSWRCYTELDRALERQIDNNTCILAAGFAKSKWWATPNMLDIWRYLLCWPWRYPYAGVAGTEAGSVVEDSMIAKREPGTAASRC